MSTATPSSIDLAQFCARYLAAWNGRDATAMGDLVTDDVVWEDPALPEPARGPAAVQEFLREAWVAFPDLPSTRATAAPHRRRRAGGVALADARDEHRGRSTRPASRRRAVPSRSRESTARA